MALFSRRATINFQKAGFDFFTLRKAWKTWNYCSQRESKGSDEHVMKAGFGRKFIDEETVGCNSSPVLDKERYRKDTTSACVAEVKRTCDVLWSSQWTGNCLSSCKLRVVLGMMKPLPNSC